MIGETIIISTPESLLAVYIVEGEIGRKGRVVVETDEQGVTVKNIFYKTQILDHENSAEILQTIGTCLHDWSEEKAYDDFLEREFTERATERSGPESKKSITSEHQSGKSEQKINSERQYNIVEPKKSMQEIMRLEKIEKQKTRNIRKLMGVLGNSFSVDLDEQNQRNEFHRAYMLFQQDIITEYAQFGFDLQTLHTFATLLWKKYKKFVECI